MADALKNAIAQSLECPVCLNTFTDPKILSCSHTYCKTCLDNLLECHGNEQMLRCPVCRAETQVPNQDVSKLPANLALKSLIDDVNNQYQFCTNCESEDKPQAVFYCQDCGMYLCSTCHNKHSQWKNFISHEVFAMSEILSGKASVRRYRKCRKHPKEDEECFCSDCRRFACFRCVVMEHTKEGHGVIEAAVYESNHMKSIEDLKFKTDKKRSCFQKYVDFIDEQKDHVNNVQKQCTDDINKAYEQSVRQLTEKKEILIVEVKGKTEAVKKELDEMKKSAQEHITHLITVDDLITTRTKIPADMDALAAHDTLCQDLQEALKQEDPDYEKPRQSSKKGKSVSFKRNIGMDELSLGKIVNAVAKNISLPTKDGTNAMVGTPDGRMAVGCRRGGVENVREEDLSESSESSDDSEDGGVASANARYLPSLAIATPGDGVYRPNSRTSEDGGLPSANASFLALAARARLGDGGARPNSSTSEDGGLPSANARFLAFAARARPGDGGVRPNSRTRGGRGARNRPTSRQRTPEPNLDWWT